MADDLSYEFIEVVDSDDDSIVVKKKVPKKKKTEEQKQTGPKIAEGAADDVDEENLYAAP